MTTGRQGTGERGAARKADRLAGRLAARGAKRADDFVAALLAWSDATGTERAVLSVEKRLSGLAAALFGRRTVLGSLGGEEVAPSVLSLTLASRADDDCRLAELAVELLAGTRTEPEQLRWSVLRAPAASAPAAGVDPDGVAAVEDWSDARQALIAYWGQPRGDA